VAELLHERGPRGRGLLHNPITHPYHGLQSRCKGKDFSQNRKKKWFYAGYKGLARKVLYISENQTFSFLRVLTWPENEGGQYARVLTPLENRRGQHEAVC
jgi:hypothetical protein